MTAATQLSADENDVKRTILDVIAHGSSYDVEKLAPLYADSLQIVRVSQDGKTLVLTKNDVMKFFESRRAANAAPLNTDANFNHIEAKNGMAHVILTRTMRLFGNLEKSLYSICLIKKDTDWKVVKETVVSLA